ncbi:hypothetical protein F0562_003973 [Nyssa sinensis]|uniref:peroxidase n=1 Tax=Nyssa sinensis TaxID=561372 RepID=A0A5J5BY13_9ASTE|nr:hypothetical protein F0562_003973 [Nyssa sinensis]
MKLPACLLCMPRFFATARTTVSYACRCQNQYLLTQEQSSQVPRLKPDTIFTRPTTLRLRSSLKKKISDRRPASLVPGDYVKSCDGFGTFGFDIHHRYSDPVKGILDLDGLPEKGSLEYYTAMAHRDRLIHGRRLADTVDPKPLAFAYGNETFRIPSLGYLHYANVSLGTPSLWFLVALDTGSDLFWLPCDCISCVKGFVTRSGRETDFNIYSLNTSSTGMKVPCNSTLCDHRKQCSESHNTCPYHVRYLSNDTSTTGFLVEDVLHLITDDSRSKVIDARVTFGCGRVQTGSLLDGAAPNGLFGLGMENISVPSILASAGHAANSFSMCFGPDGIGRISFGDRGTSDQGETPFNLNSLRPTYNISMTQIIVEGNVTDVNFNAIFDSGTSFTYLNDPAYTIISERFNSKALEKRHPSDSKIPFEYCYDLSANQTSFEYPTVNLTMKGGDQFYVIDPIVIVPVKGGYLYCLAVVKSGDINIIGQNFMTGYRIVFDNEKMVLGWKASDCYDAKDANTLPINPTKSHSPAAAPTTTVEPKVTSRPGNVSPARSPSMISTPGNSLSLNYYDQTCPNAESIITNAVNEATKTDKTVPAALLRMHFHDCFIRGCDASVLLNSNGNNSAEKDGPPNISLHAFYVIDNAKKQLEASCPGIVSCADILALAARDAVVITGGPTWDVPKGRKDGRTSKASDSLQLPFPTFNFSQLQQSFSQRGLSIKDLVALSGGHTLGFSHCSSFQSRIHFFNSTNDIDPSIHPSFAASLRNICPVHNKVKNAGVTMDPSATTFDNTYYKLILQKKVLFSSDQALLTVTRSKELVSRFAASKEAFWQAFAKSMIKMSSIAGGQEVRKNCRVVN